MRVFGFRGGLGQGEPIPYDAIRTALGDLDYPKLITNPLAPTESAGFRIPGPWRQMRPTMASDRQLEVRSRIASPALTRSA